MQKAFFFVLAPTFKYNRCANRSENLGLDKQQTKVLNFYVVAPDLFFVFLETFSFEMGKHCHLSYIK